MTAPLSAGVQQPRILDARPRAATPDDNPALLALAAACEMRGDIGLRIDREPDFFALNRLEGDQWQLGVVPGLAPRSVAGCVAASARRVYIDGAPRLTTYVGDFKVHPAHRGGPAADALGEYARQACREMAGSAALSLMTVLAGNSSMERRVDGPRGLPVLTRFATIRSHAIPFLWNRGGVPGFLVGQACEDDLEEMATLWEQLAPRRQFAPVIDAASLARTITDTPGLDLESYWVARDSGGRIAGFVAAWDQTSFKQLRVTSYSRRLSMVRGAFNLVAPLSGSTPLPPAGGQLRCLSAYNVCVPGDEPAVLRALLLRIYAAKRAHGYSCLNVGLDVRDPLTAALHGLLAQPTDIHAYITTPAGTYTGPPLGTRPLHYETALV